MILKYIIMALTSIGGGAVISGAVFALISSTGVVTIFSIDIPFGANFSQGFQVIMGLAQGVFVGCLAVSLAEALNGTAIFSRRVKLKMGLSFIVLSIALGKVVAALIQFGNNWVKK